MTAVIRTFRTLIFGSTLIVASAQAQNPSTLQLSETKVKELVFTQGLQKQEVDLRYDQFALNPKLVLAGFDWNVTVESGYEWDRTVSVLSTSNSGQAEYERFRTTASLRKNFYQTGTLLGLEFNRLSQEVTSSGNASLPSQQTLGNAGIILEQALWGNFLGAADRNTVKAAELTYKAQSIAKSDELENVILEGVRLFWISYVAKRNYDEALNSRNRYRDLVGAIRRKTSLGYSNPGDLPQIQAELESREQFVQTSYTDFKTQEEKLLTLLNIADRPTVQYDINTKISPPPAFVEKDIQQLRAVQTQKLLVEAADSALTSTKSSSHPTLNLVGRAYSSGIGTTGDDSNEQLLSGTKPKYYVGVKFQYNFGSDIQADQIRSKQLSRDLQETRLKRTLLESEDLKSSVNRNLTAYYTIAESALKQKNLREQASRELNNSYGQGRTDISILISAINSYYNSEIQYIRALGDYQMALNEYLAFSDELIK